MYDGVTSATTVYEQLLEYPRKRPHYSGLRRETTSPVLRASAGTGLDTRDEGLTRSIADRVEMQGARQS